MSVSSAEEDVFEFGELGEREGKLLGAGLYVGDAAHHRQLVQTYFTEYALKVDTRPVEEVGDDGELDQPQIDGVALCLVSGKQLAERVTLGGYHLLALVKETGDAVGCLARLGAYDGTAACKVGVLPSQEVNLLVYSLYRCHGVGLSVLLSLLVLLSLSEASHSAIATEMCTGSLKREWLVWLLSDRVIA